MGSRTSGPAHLLVTTTWGVVQEWTKAVARVFWRDCCAAPPRAPPPSSYCHIMVICGGRIGPARMRGIRDITMETSRGTGRMVWIAAGCSVVSRGPAARAPSEAQSVWGHRQYSSYSNNSRGVGRDAASTAITRSRDIRLTKGAYCYFSSF